MRRLRLVTLTVTLAASPARILPSQTPAAPPFSCADTTARALGFLVGEYSAHAVFRAGRTAWDSSAARVSISRELGGCILREHFRGRRYGSPYDYLALWSANGVPGQPIERAFVHSQHGILGVSSGQWVGDTLVLEDSVFVRERWIFQRHVLWREASVGRNAGRVLRSEGRRSEDARATWFVTQRTRYVRRTN